MMEAFFFIVCVLSLVVLYLSWRIDTLKGRVSELEARMDKVQRDMRFKVDKP